jgi:acetoin utilization deacetylase AcuC-like enzyme
MFMRILFNKKFLNHNNDSQFEGPYRLEKFEDHHTNDDVNGEQFISLVHPKTYVNQIKKACQNKDFFAEINLTPASYEAAIRAVGLTVKASEKGNFAVVRPPGHHANVEKTSGFCLFNNMAIAAQKLANEGKKVFIFDFDGHHGDGTQAIFYNSNKVFYCSLHQLNSYPYTGSPIETGVGEGEGFTLNIPLMPGSSDKVFLEVLDKVISAAIDFQPDVVAVSAGFDGFIEDNLLSLKFTLKGYYECGLRLRRIFPNVFAVLEGGYHSKVKECIEAFVNGVNVGARPIKNTFDFEMSIG